MTQPEERDNGSIQELVQRMTVGDRADGVVEKVIPFVDDDIPKYLENLDRFEEESRKVRFRIG